MLEEAIHWEVDTQGGVSQEKLCHKSARRGWLLGEVDHCAMQESSPRDPTQEVFMESWNDSEQNISNALLLSGRGHPITI